MSAPRAAAQLFRIAMSLEYFIPPATARAGTAQRAVPTNAKSRRLELINGFKAMQPSGGFQAPSPKRRRPGLRVSCSPTATLSPRRGRALARRRKTRTSRLQSPPLCRFGVTRLSSWSVLPMHGRVFLPLLQGEGWGEGERSKLQP